MAPELQQSAGPELEAIWRLVAARTGFAVGGVRRLQLVAGLRRAMDRAGFAETPPYVARLRADSAALDELVEELLIGESYFFREPNQCRLLREEILPQLRRAADTRDGASVPRRALRVWSAGCAAGEEAYTLAMLLEEAGESDAFLLASDISRRALDLARMARFRAWSLRSLEPAVVQRWFLAVGDGFQVRDPLPSRVTFDRINLVTDEFPSLGAGVWAMDLVVCRNALIYFDRDKVERVADRLFASLAPGGWLLTGSSDPPLQDLAPFEVVERTEGIFYRRPGGAEVSARPHRSWPVSLVPPPIVADLPVARPPAAALPAPEPVAPAPPPAARAPLPVLDDVAARLQVGDYNVAAALAAQLAHEPGAWALRVRAVANLRGPAEAVLDCERGLRQHGLSVELHYLMAALLLALGRDGQALDAARRVVYLDRSLAVGHLLMATILRRLGDGLAAVRSCQRAAELARSHGDGEQVPLGEGLTWGALRASLDRQLRDGGAGGQGVA